MNRQAIEISQVQKKTFNIEIQNVRDMEFFIGQRKQTEFVNRAIKHELEREQESLERQEAIKSLVKLEKIRQSMPKSLLRSEDIIRELREEPYVYIKSLVPLTKQATKIF